MIAASRISLKTELTLPDMIGRSGFTAAKTMLLSATAMLKLWMPKLSVMKKPDGIAITKTEIKNCKDIFYINLDII